jgi:hypothetical protein
MPNVPGKGLVYSQPFYDTIIAPAAAAGAFVGQFFAVPFGGLIAAGVAKNYRHTNFVQAGRLETGNELQIGAVTMHFPITAEAGALPTIADKRALRSGNIRLRFGGDTEFLKIPTTLLPSAAAGEIVVDATVAANDVQNGVQAIQNKFFLDEALILRAQESVSVFIENMDAIVAPTSVCFVLWGTAIRPVR